MKSFSILNLAVLPLLLAAAPDNELEELLALRGQLKTAETEEALLKAEVGVIEHHAQVLRTAAQVTVDPSKRPPLRGKQQPKLLFSDAMDSGKQWGNTSGKVKTKTETVDGRQVIFCAAPFSKTHEAESLCRGIRLPEGKTVKLTIWVKGIDVKATRPGGGSRVGLLVTDAAGKTFWHIAPSSTGTFDWTEKTQIVQVPHGYRGASFNLGLAGAVGKVYLKDLKLEQLD